MWCTVVILFSMNDTCLIVCRQLLVYIFCASLMHETLPASWWQTVLVMELNVSVGLFYHVIESKSSLSCLVFRRMSYCLVALHFSISFGPFCVIYYKLSAVLFLSSTRMLCHRAHSSAIRRYRRYATCDNRQTAVICNVCIETPSVDCSDTRGIQVVGDSGVASHTRSMHMHFACWKFNEGCLIVVTYKCVYFTTYFTHFCHFILQLHFHGFSMFHICISISYFQLVSSQSSA